MATRKNYKSKKSKKRFRKTRSKRQKGGDDDDVCPICTDPMDDDNKIIITDCKKKDSSGNMVNAKHTFHKKCLIRWCKISPNLQRVLYAEKQFQYV